MDETTDERNDTPVRAPPLAPPRLGWEGTAPVADAFGDMYYNPENGLAESEYVFPDGVGFDTLAATRDHLVIAETGFGTGLNFLATWARWKRLAAPCRLTFISTEAYPMTLAQLARTHAPFARLATEAAALRDAWPPPAPGFHLRLFEEGRIALLLLLGEAGDMLHALDAGAGVDAWYLDGFAPAKNPDMWRPDVLDQIARLSGPGTRLATFTAAGFVRRGLADRGFAVRKAPGFGRKKERLLAEGIRPAPCRDDTGRQKSSDAGAPPPWAERPASTEGPVNIVGAGIAAASLAHALIRRGRDVTVIAPGAADGPHRGGLDSHGLPAAIMAPRLHLGHGMLADFAATAFLHAAGHPLIRRHMASPAGLLLKADNADALETYGRLLRRHGWGPDWMRLGQDGLWLPRAGTVDAPALLEALLAGTDRLNYRAATLTVGEDDEWILKDGRGQAIARSPVCVLAAGMATRGLADVPADVSGDISGDVSGDVSGGTTGGLELRPVAGQVEMLPPDALPDGLPPSGSAGTYLTATLNDRETGLPLRTIGATFDKLRAVPTAPIRPNADARRKLLAGFEADWAAPAVTNPSGPDGNGEGEFSGRAWAGLRATTPDHLPHAGPLPDWRAFAALYAPLSHDARRRDLPAPVYRQGLYTLTGLGSKGFQYAPLAGEIVAALITGDPLPVPRHWLAGLHPGRHLIRQIIRGQSSHDAPPRVR